MNYEKMLEELENYKLSKETIYNINKIFFDFKGDLKQYDAILVLGGKNVYRAKTAIEIYNKINVPIIFSGGVKHDKENTEAEIYKKYAIDNGVKEIDIIAENKSLNTYENFTYSFPILLKLINKKQINVLIITNPIHIPRSLYLANKVIRENNYKIKVHAYPSYSDIYNKDNWYLHKNSIDFVKSELSKNIEMKILK